MHYIMHENLCQACENKQQAFLAKKLMLGDNGFKFSWISS